ncbi:MAG TPA: ABC transporter substrate-binding protein [Stellaceae bacterium]|nr:ABC transporter substrate-binding protein [Stellaceae bacterium]
MRLATTLLVALAFAAWMGAPPAGAEAIKIGVVHNSAQGPIYLAVERGYFAAEGLEASIVGFDAAQPVAVAVVSGDIDFGNVAATGGFYSLAGQGALKIIGGNSREAPGFQLFGLVVASAVYDAGFKTAKDLAGHSAAVTQVGSGYHYALALMAEKYGVDLETVRVLPMQAIPNIASALTGGQVDSAILNATASAPLRQRGSVKLVAWSGDETPYQATVLFTSTRNADGRHDTVERYMRAYRKGAHDYYAAFVGPDGKRADGATAHDVAAIISKYSGLTPEQVMAGIAFVDPDARLDEKDILRQIAWFKSQGMVKGEVSRDQAIDKRYAVPLPEPRS